MNGKSILGAALALSAIFMGYAMGQGLTRGLLGRTTTTTTTT